MYNFGPINQITNNKLNKNKVDKDNYNSKVSELESKNIQQDNIINQKVNQSEYNTKINDLETVNNRQDAQISQMIQNPGTATEGNAELIDIRIGYDGTKYSTSGDAVRGQIQNNYNYIFNIEKDIKDSFFLKYNLKSNYYIDKHGNETYISTDFYQVTDFLKVSKNMVIILKNYANYKNQNNTYCAFYDENEQFLKSERLLINNEDMYMQVPENEYFRTTVTSPYKNSCKIFICTKKTFENIAQQFKKYEENFVKKTFFNISTTNQLFDYENPNLINNCYITNEKLTSVNGGYCIYIPIDYTKNKIVVHRNLKGGSFCYCYNNRFTKNRNFCF